MIEQPENTKVVVYMFIAVVSRELRAEEIGKVFTTRPYSSFTAAVTKCEEK